MRYKALIYQYDEELEYTYYLEDIEDRPRWVFKSVADFLTPSNLIYKGKNKSYILNPITRDVKIREDILTLSTAKKGFVYEVTDSKWDGALLYLREDGGYLLKQSRSGHPDKKYIDENILCWSIKDFKDLEIKKYEL